MKFLIDANLPFRLAVALKSKGHDIIHTDDLLYKERTIVITKDSDFLDSHIIQGVPAKLLLVTTGNIINRDLIGLFDRKFETIIQLFEIYDVIELGNDQINWSRKITTKPTNGLLIHSNFFNHV